MKIPMITTKTHKVGVTSGYSSENSIVRGNVVAPTAITQSEALIDILSVGRRIRINIRTKSYDIATIMLYQLPLA